MRSCRRVIRGGPSRGPERLKRHGGREGVMAAGPRTYNRVLHQLQPVHVPVPSAGPSLPRAPAEQSGSRCSGRKQLAATGSQTLVQCVDCRRELITSNGVE